MNQSKETKPLFNHTIFLIGFMGTGKSTVAEHLEKMLGMERIEMDALIQEQNGMKISDIFKTYGENYFRDLESDLLIKWQTKNQVIVSCGGGVVIRPENAVHMKKHGCVVWLKASPETIYDRVKDSKERPILNDHMNVTFIEELLKKRLDKYEKAADVIVETDGKDVTEICEEIISKLMKQKK